MRITAFVVFILIGARVFSLVFQGVGGKEWIEGLLIACPAAQRLPDLRQVFVFVLAFFLDFFEIAFIVIPLLAPVAQKLGIDLIWFGVLLGANMQTSFMHPPFGFALFYLRGIAPRTRCRAPTSTGCDTLAVPAGPAGRYRDLVAAVGDLFPRQGPAGRPQHDRDPGAGFRRHGRSTELRPAAGISPRPTSSRLRAGHRLPVCPRLRLASPGSGDRTAEGPDPA